MYKFKVLSVACIILAISACSSNPVREVVDLVCEYDGEKLHCIDEPATAINYDGLVELSQRPKELDQCFALVAGELDRKVLRFADRCRLAD